MRSRLGSRGVEINDNLKRNKEWNKNKMKMKINKTRIEQNVKIKDKNRNRRKKMEIWEEILKMLKRNTDKRNTR